MATDITADELQLAHRNAAMPLEALRWPITPLGLHYLLIHYDIPQIDADAFRLSVGGSVEHPLELTLEDLQQRERVEIPVTMECAGNGRAHFDPRPVSQPWLGEAIGTATWIGTPLAALLDEASPTGAAVEVVFTGADRGVEGEVPQDYERSLTLDEARTSGAVLAYAINDVPLPPQHGFPLRLVVPGWYGMTNVKWLTRITAVDEPFTGYQQAQGYRMRKAKEDVGTPVTRIMPRSLIRPPGVPDFMTRKRFVERAPQTLEGRAWSGWGAIERVAVSTDGARTWADAELGDAPGPFAWRAFSFTWEPAGPGEYELACRATDAAGNVQPLEPDWNVGGYQNNAVQRIPVTVTE